MDHRNLNKIFRRSGRQRDPTESARRQLGLEALDDRAVEIETGADQRAAGAAAAIDRDGMRAELQPAMMAVEAADDLAEAGIGCGQIKEAGTAPPETVMLGRERPRRVDAGMDEEQLVAAGEGG